jgi:ABC-2 type transport system permease protein
MKNKTILLARTLIRNGEGLGMKGSSTFAKAAVYIMFLIVIPSMMIGIGVFVAGLMGALKQIGQEGVVLSWGIALNSAVVFVFGVFYIISSFYFSSDIENLLPLPLKPRQIMGAKFLVVTIYEYLTTAFIFMPLLITYGVKTGSGLLYYLYGLIIFLLMPIAPLAAASVLVMVIMRFTNLSRHKDLFKILGGVLAIFLGLGVNVVMQNTMQSMSPEQLMELVQKGNNSLIGVTSSVFPTARRGAEALIYSSSMDGFVSFLIFAGFSIAIYIALLWLGELLYLRGVVGLSESGARRNKVSKQELEKAIVKRPVVRTYAMVELKLLFRTPIYFVNCVMINFLWPVFFVFPLLFKTEGTDVLGELIGVLNKPGLEGSIMAGAFALALFLGGTNAVAPTAISREGQEFFVKKYLPVSYKQQITAKVISAFALGLVAILAMVAFAVFMFEMSPWLGLLILATAWLPILFTCYTGLLIYLYNPKLDWDNEQKAVKQNMNVLYNMIVGVVFALPTIGGAIAFSQNLVVTAIVLIVVFGLLTFLMYKLVYTLGVKRFAQLEG